MDGMSMSNESLWSILSGTSVVYSNTIVGKQLEEGEEKFSKGILYYAKPAGDSKIKSQKMASTSSAQKDFLSKIVKLIDVSESVAEELLFSYLVSEFRGTSRSLSVLLSSERHQQALLVSVWRFYHTERLYLLMGLRQIIARHADTAHPYQPLFAKFLTEVIDKGGRLLASLLDQLEWSLSAEPPSWRHSEPLSSPAARDTWVSSALKEQAELLQCLLVYCQQRQALSHKQLVRLVGLFTRHALGPSPPYAQLVTEQHSELLRSVTLLQTIVCIHGLQLDVPANQVSGLPVQTPHLLSSESGRAELERSLPLGGRPEHGPLLLAWLLVLHTMAEGGGAEKRRAALTRRCRQLDVLRYTREMLTEAEVFQNRTSMIGKIARATIYSVVDLLLLCFDATNLGDEKDLVTICAEVLAVPHLAAEFWTVEPALCGLRLLFDDVTARFPADAPPLLELCAGLARAGGDSLDKVVSFLQRVPCFAEPAAAVPGGSASVSQAGQLWTLQRPRRPDRRLPQLQLAAGTQGRVLAGRLQLVSWAAPHSGWQQALLFLDDIQQEGQLGEQHVQPETTERAGAVACLLRAVMETGSAELLRQLRPHIDLLFPILERHYRWGSPPQSFVHHAAEVLALFARVEPHYVWEHMDRNRLLPRGGAGSDPVHSVEAGRLGELIEAHECVQRRYPLTQAFLHLLHNTVQASPEPPPAALVPAVAFVLRDVFPAHVRWQYARRGEETALGRACLRLLDALLPPERPGPLRRLVVRALTDGPAAETLLSLVVHGEARIVLLLEEQTHWDTGAGLEFIRLIHVALSVLNRLLVLRCREDHHQDQPEQPRGESLLETLLTSQPAGRGQLRPVLAVAQYLFHRHNPHLPTLAIRLLLRLAKVFPMSLLASFGQDSDVICSVILRRLRAETEDVSLKVAVLDFLATCVTSQPGLLQRLLGVGAVESEDGAKKKAEQDDEGGFLEELLAIFKEHQRSERWESPLLLAAASLVHALWLGQCGAALTHLTSSERFWADLTAPLLSVTRPPPLPLAAHLLRTLALQLYYARKPDPRLTTLMGKVTGDRGRLLNYWSKMVCDAAGGLAGDLNSSVVVLDSEGDALDGGRPSSAERQEDGASLLLAWRDWCLVAATPGSFVALCSDSQQRILIDLMSALERQLGSAAGRPRLLGIMAELVMMLTARWKQQCGEPAVRERVWSLLEACSSQFEELPVRARSAVLTTALRTLQHGGASDADASSSARCLAPCCDMLELALVQCEPADCGEPAERLAGLAALLLRQLLTGPAARRLLSRRLTLTALLTALSRRLRQARQPRLCQHLLQTALSAVSEQPAAQQAVSLGLAGELGLPLAELRHQLGSELSDEWRVVWVLSIHLWTHLLRSQKHFFVADAVDFAAVHCVPLCAAVSQLRTRLQPSDLEETEAAVSFVASLMSFSVQWRQRHRHSYDTLLSWLKGCVGVCFWYICRGRIVSLLLERNQTLAGREELQRIRRLSSSEPEPERPPPQVTAVQNRLMRLSSVCLVALHALSPPLPLLLTRDGLPLDDWEPLVGTGFASPTLDKPGPPPLTFGTMLAGVNVCVRPLTKSDRPSSGGEARVERRPLLVLLHQTLVLVLAQAALLQLRPPPAAEDQLNRGHLREELKSFLESLKRDQRRGLAHSPSVRHHQETAAGDEGRFLELMEHLVNTVLK